jgi:D-alanine-D-alanine ligase
MKQLHVALVYNAFRAAAPEAPEDGGSTHELLVMIRVMARRLRAIGHRVTVVPLANDLLAFQRRLRRLRPDVVFNQYDDVVHGALYEMRVAALVRMMGIPLTGSPALALGICRNKFITSTLLQGAGIPAPRDTTLLERVTDVDRRRWHFPVIVQTSQEHAGVGLGRDSVVYTKKALKAKVRQILGEYSQPAIAQCFLTGREFNVGLVGGRRLRVMPFAEINYSQLPPEIPPIMSYAAKWIETTVEFKRTSAVCPAAVTASQARQISTTALRAFRAVGGWGYGRVDIRMDARGTPCVLDVNCNPSLEEDVALARSARVAGIDYPRLLQMIIQAALEPVPYDVNVPMMGGPPPAAGSPVTP